MKQKAQIYSVVGLFVGIVIIFWLGFSTARKTDATRGFRLPPGDVNAGQAAFIELGCSNCHSIRGQEDFARPAEFEDLIVPLGGPVQKVKTYGELVTAIIHPSESIHPDVKDKYVDVEGNSLMPDLTNAMTTRQMIDLVTYLEEQYEISLPEYPSNYYPYLGDFGP